jgi:hypothetical protein
MRAVGGGNSQLRSVQGPEKFNASGGALMGLLTLQLDVSVPYAVTGSCLRRNIGTQRNRVMTASRNRVKSNGFGASVARFGREANDG